MQSFLLTLFTFLYLQCASKPNYFNDAQRNAFLNKDEIKIEKHLESKGIFTKVDKYGNTVLHLAIYKGDANTVKKILRIKEPNILSTLIKRVNSIGYTPLALAVAKKQKKITLLLLEYKDSLLFEKSISSGGVQNPLFWAGLHFRKEIHKLILNSNFSGKFSFLRDESSKDQVVSKQFNSIVLLYFFEKEKAFNEQIKNDTGVAQIINSHKLYQNESYEKFKRILKYESIAVHICEPTLELNCYYISSEQQPDRQKKLQLNLKRSGKVKFIKSNPKLRKKMMKRFIEKIEKRLKSRKKQIAG